MSELLIGLGKVDITPPVGATLVGYNARTSTSLDMPLYAEALVCRRGDDGWVLLTCDLLGFAANLVTSVRQCIAAATPLRGEQIMLSVTHTHSGPNTIARQLKDAPAVDEDYRSELIEKLSAMAIDAWNNASPGRLRFAHCKLDVHAHNRRIYDEENAAWANEWRDPEARHPGFVDHQCSIVSMENPDGTRRGLLVNYGCHPVTLGPGSLAISPDYVGYLKQHLAELQGIEQVHFALAGAANINPLDCINTETAATADMGRAIAETIHLQLDKLQMMQRSEIQAAQKPWIFERTRTRPKEKQMKDEQAAIETEFQLLACDDLAIIALPGELFSEFNQMLRDVSAWPCTIVASITNDYIGYLPTDAAMAEGAYEVKMAPATGLEAMIMEHCGELLGQRNSAAVSS